MSNPARREITGRTTPNFAIQDASTVVGASKVVSYTQSMLIAVFAFSRSKTPMKRPNRARSMVIPTYRWNKYGPRPVSAVDGVSSRLPMRDHNLGSSDGLWTAFEAEAMPHLDRLFRLAMWWERDRREAEDLVQDTLVQALQSFHRFTPGTNCRAWLVTILRHVRNNRRRTTLRRLAAEEPDDRIDETVPFVPPVPQHLTDDEVLAALRGIPEAYQDVIVLCDVEGLTYKEIATALTIPMGTVMSRLHRGRTMLRQRLGSTITIARAPRLVDVTSSRGSK